MAAKRYFEFSSLERLLGFFEGVAWVNDSAIEFEEACMAKDEGRTVYYLSFIDRDKQESESEEQPEGFSTGDFFDPEDDKFVE